MAGTSQWLAAGVGLAVGALLLILGIIMYSMSRRRHEPPEERLLNRAIAKLRVELGITAEDGFLLTSEHGRGIMAVCSWQRKPPVFLQRSFVEAAARLSMLQEFDMHQFDAFCTCLRCSTGENELSENSVTPAYSALCNWLLDISKTLIKPEIPSLGKSGGDSIKDNSCCQLAFEERFSYFQRRVCRAQLWSDMGGSLFQRLKDFAQVFIFA